MAYNPVSGAAIQYVNSNGNVADGYYLKFYIANTTTPLSMATDSTGGTTLAKCKLNDKGYPISNPLDNSTVFIPYVDQSYRWVLYPTEADADANNTAAADINIPEVAIVYIDDQGLGTAAYADLTTSSTDTTADRVTKVGDFGLGTEVNSTAYTDADSIVLGESGYVGAGGSNTPDSAEGWIIECNVGPLATIKEQKATSVSSTRYEMRYMFGGIWSSWQELYHTGNLLGAVSESSGVPTGAVIERGGNGNGEYVKFADGTMICTGDYSGAVVLVAQGNVFQGAVSFPFPATFATGPVISGGGNQTNGQGWGGPGSVKSTTTTGTLLYWSTNVGGAGSQIDWTAVGRWF